MTEVQLKNLTKHYPGTDAAAVNDVSLTIESGDFVALLGASGSGKTTILKMIAGLIPPTSGGIYFNNQRMNEVPAEKRSAVMVFQNHALFPYMSVADNVGFGLKMRGVEKGVIQKRVQEMLDLVQLPGMGARKPQALSGGQQQRIALARALIIEPDLLLLDEPLSNLDAHLRDEMRDLITSIHRRTRITTIVVTHDQQEAVLLADRIAMLFDGEMMQYAPAADFYRRPESERVARFFGSVNFLPGALRGEQVETGIGTFRIEPNEREDGPVTLTIRPEQIALVAAPGDNTATGTVEEAIFAGTHMRYCVRCGDHILDVIRSADLPGAIEPGASVHLHLPTTHLWPLPR